MEAQKKMRLSNLELLRIISMLIIISHHYVVNSTITSLFDFSDITANMVFLQLVGFGGKMAINIFVLISAYFICTQNVTWKRIVKLIAVLYFYKLVIAVPLAIAGYQPTTTGAIIKILISPIKTIGSEFVGSFLVFYLLVPFLNRFISQLNEKQHRWLALTLIGVFSLAYTFALAHNATRYVGWFICLYAVSSYIRLYPNIYTERKTPAVLCGILSLVVIIASILFVDFVGAQSGYYNWTSMCIDSQKFFAFILALSCFLFFKNLKIKQNQIINILASAAFGVLLIHANSDAMRTWLWQDFLKVPQQYESNLLPLHWLTSVLGIYLCCAAIELLRIRFIEKPFFNKINEIQRINKECFFE